MSARAPIVLDVDTGVDEGTSLVERDPRLDAPGLVFDTRLPLEQAEGYRAMDERRAIKVYLDV